MTVGNTGPYCPGESIELTATPSGAPGFSYSWSGPQSFGSTQQNPISSNATVGMSGVYSVTLTDANGCTSIGTTTVVVNSSPVVTASTNQPIYCVGNTIVLTGTGANNYQWQSPTGALFATNPLTIPNASVALHNGAWSLIGTDANGCENKSLSN